MSKIDIRKAKPNDIKDIIKLCELHANFEGVKYIPDGKEAKLSECLFQENPVLNCMVAERNGILLGYATEQRSYQHGMPITSYTWTVCIFWSKHEVKG